MFGQRAADGLAGATREFFAALAIAQRLGRPHTPTDQAWIESLFGHVKAEHPHLEQLRDPAVLTDELERVRRDYNGTRLHAGIGRFISQPTSAVFSDTGECRGACGA